MGASFRVSATGVVITRSSLLQSVTLTGGSDAATARLFDASGLFMSAQVGGNFQNQPTNDGIEIVSDSALDVGQVLTVYGTTTGTTTVVQEDIVSNGTTFVPSEKVNWGEILGVHLNIPLAGTLTVRKATGDATITTITTGSLTSGILLVAEASQRFSGYPYIFASAGTTKVIGVVGDDSNATATVNNAAALTGATALRLGTKMRRIKKVLVGDVESARTVSMLSGEGGLPFMKTAASTPDSEYFDNYALKRGLYVILTGTAVEFSAVEA